MSAVLEKPRTGRVVKTTPQKHDWRPLFIAMQAKVPPLLWVVHDRTDDSLCESAFRLSALAARMLEQHTLGDVRDEMGNDHDSDNLVYDCLALIASAKATNGQELDELSLSVLQLADDMLHAVMFVMTDSPSAQEIQEAHVALATNGGAL